MSETIPHLTVRNATLVVSHDLNGEILTGLQLFGGRILPKRLWEAEESLDRLLETLRSIVDDGGSILDVGINPTKEVAGNLTNAVLRAFRTMHSMCLITLPWNDTASWREQFADTASVTTLEQRFAALAPETGAYLNEANPFDPNWKRNFYGANYDRLLRIKDKWDPDQTLYGTTAVGGDRWVTVDGGRLCPRN